MKIRNFDLSLPDEERDVRTAFCRETRCLSSLYERHFSGIVTDKCWKVLVECVGRATRERSVEALGVSTIQVPFVFSEYDGLGGYEKKVLAVDALHRGAMQVAAERGWPLSPLVEALAGVVSSNYVNEWTWGAAKASPRRDYRASVDCSFEPAQFTAWLRVRGRNGDELARHMVVKTAPTEFAFAQKFGKLSWLSETRVALLDKKGDVVGEVSV